MAASMDKGKGKGHTTTRHEDTTDTLPKTVTQ
jgi:hypothetical protein